MDDIADLDPFVRDELLERFLQQLDLERLDSREPILEFRQERERPRLPEVLFDRLRIVRDPVDEEKVGIQQNVAGYFQSVAGRLDDPRELRPDIAGGRARNQTGSL